ncbi:MAG: hypothetical protein ACR2RD_14075, partial [Woeseiaceae bacterium]
MFTLIGTLFDIIRLRSGPDAVPHSTFLFVVFGLMWLLAGVLMTVATAELDQTDFVIGSVTGIAGLLCYAAVVMFSGRGA